MLSAFILFDIRHVYVEITGGKAAKWFAISRFDRKAQFSPYKKMLSENREVTYSNVECCTMCRNSARLSGVSSSLLYIKHDFHAITGSE
ncbi:hypothetical protein NYE27_15065 [Paenibacillus sp. FSL R10-2779]|uniref:hypothetical protein n=1 Tax=Paenibacillus TaxID=44249 RepID=UPI0015C3415C|nr:hypothetical protein [Paenibacillus odorifer]